MSQSNLPTAYVKDLDKVICKTCGAQYPHEERDLSACVICLDDRQYVPESGQAWTSLRELLDEDVQTTLEPWKHDNNVLRIKNEPGVGISQTPILLLTERGYIIWDCSAYMSPSALHTIQGYFSENRPFLGIAISHPHFYNSAATICRALREGMRGKSAEAMVYAHAADRVWWMRTDDLAIVNFWEGASYNFIQQSAEKLSMIRCGGHFPGSCVLHWQPKGSKTINNSISITRSLVLCSDTFMIAPDRKTISFMYSYPNQVPLSPKEVGGIWQAIAYLGFNRALSAWPGREIVHDAKSLVLKSALRFTRIAGLEPLQVGIDEQMSLYY
ncbi:hypothetical protein PUNSTDRAFT_98270 [Punctularia strigosozonata HHB-11173 SS5]|uniref:uncharacterized protein n=1 Tax=Punctularia strigosozonata (strain HHB-11173) TaxID=741275 RepID=UPI0004416CAB|nr:uncharacterized protein PUNSTDRAFT_98270 [Punctularia strigosozonata HHB-11173 SS5]EIN11210.1 hypothetical protein PUNSTDRAFT_98270 [Punctularia strigosozonata HHB-11173 SS5]